jgi:hypothetical protein
VNAKYTVLLPFAPGPTGSTILQSDETGLRAGEKNWRLRVFHHDDSALFAAASSRAKSMVADFLGGFRPGSGCWTAMAGKGAGRQ